MVRLAVVGLRNIGKGHVNRAKMLEGVSVVAGVDTDETRRNEAREKFGFEYVCAEVERVLDDPQIDGVILALPNHLGQSQGRGPCASSIQTGPPPLRPPTGCR